MPSAADIMEQYRERQAETATLHEKMHTVSTIYNGKMRIPLADIDRAESASVPNLLAQGVDQMAARIASTVPTITYVPDRPGVRESDRNARNAADTLGAWWEMGRRMKLQQVIARRLVAYAMCPVIISWDHDRGIPKWRVRHPLETLPPLDIEPDVVRPTDIIFTYYRSAKWLLRNGYGMHLNQLTRGQHRETDRIRLIEYVDSDETVLMATGFYPNEQWDLSMTTATGKAVVLVRHDNPAGMPVVLPNRMTLDSIAGQFDTMIGMYQHQAKLMALEEIAIEKDIFPDTYLEGRANEVPKFISGPHDGRSGDVNIVQGGTVKTLQSSPGYLTNPFIDRLERSMRLTAGIPAEFGGESASNIRTGRRGDAVLSAVIDFTIAEAQGILAHAMEDENEICIKLAKAHAGSTTRTLHVGLGNSRRPVTYTPDTTFKHVEQVVSYPVAGTDMNTFMLGLGQRLGMGMISKRTAQELDPLIANPEGEHDAIIVEGLEMAVMSGIQQQAASGQLPPLAAAKIATLVGTDKMELAEAMVKVTEDAIKEQQAQQQAQAQMQPQAPTADSMMAGPAAQALTGSQVPGVSAMPGMSDVADMMGVLRRPLMTITPGRNADQGAV